MAGRKVLRNEIIRAYDRYIHNAKWRTTTDAAECSDAFFLSGWRKTMDRIDGSYVSIGSMDLLRLMAVLMGLAR